MSKKIILIIVAAVFVAGVFIGGAGVYLWNLWKKCQFLTEPKQTEQSECEKITYFNKTYSYTLKIPKEWAGKYEIREEGNTTSFVYNVIPELKELLFSVTVYSKEEWEKELKEREESEKKGLAPGCCPGVFAKINGTVFEYNILVENPYSGGRYEDIFFGEEIAEEYGKMARQIQEIIASFSLSK